MRRRVILSTPRGAHRDRSDLHNKRNSTLRCKRGQGCVLEILPFPWGLNQHTSWGRRWGVGGWGVWQRTVPPLKIEAPSLPGEVTLPGDITFSLPLA